MRLGERPFRAHDPLRDRRHRNEECARDLVRRQPAEETQGERGTCLGGEDRMAGDEHEAKQIVADGIVDRIVELVHIRLLPRFELTAELLMLAIEQSSAPNVIDRAMVRRGHEPGARIVGSSRLRPLLERGDERVLRELLSHADVADDAGEPGDDPRRLDPPDCFDCGMWISSRHGCRSHHLQTLAATGRRQRA